MIHFWLSRSEVAQELRYAFELRCLFFNPALSAKNAEQSSATSSSFE
jgi:hypothetical protein